MRKILGQNKQLHRGSRYSSKKSPKENTRCRTKGKRKRTLDWFSRQQEGKVNEPRVNVQKPGTSGSALERPGKCGGQPEEEPQARCTADSRLGDERQCSICCCGRPPPSALVRQTGQAADGFAATCHCGFREEGSSALARKTYHSGLEKGRRHDQAAARRLSPSRVWSIIIVINRGREQASRYGGGEGSGREGKRGRHGNHLLERR